MKIKPTLHDIGDLVIVNGPRPGLKRTLTIQEIVVTVTAKGKERVQYGFKESLWRYSERMLEKPKKTIKRERGAFDEFD